jgi:hypothetical protein
MARLAAGTLLVAAALLISPDRAAAECGDYVTIQDGRSNHAMPGPAAGDHLPKTPCHGPGCSKLPTVPFSPIPTPVTASADAKALALGLGDVPPTAGGRTIPVSSAAAPTRQPDSIFHPPRV